MLVAYQKFLFRDSEKVDQIDYSVDNVIVGVSFDVDYLKADFYSVQMVLYSSDDIKSVGGQRDSDILFDRNLEIGQFEISDSGAGK